MFQRATFSKHNSNTLVSTADMLQYMLYRSAGNPDFLFMRIGTEVYSLGDSGFRPSGRTSETDRIMSPFYGDVTITQTT